MNDKGNKGQAELKLLIQHMEKQALDLLGLVNQLIQAIGDNKAQDVSMSEILRLIEEKCQRFYLYIDDMRTSCKHEFTHVLAFDLRVPTTSIHSWIDFLQMEDVALLDKDFLHSSVNSIQMNSQKLLGLLADLSLPPFDCED